jgi:hypothetical protein
VTLTNPPLVSSTDIAGEAAVLLNDFLASSISLREKIGSHIAYQEFVKYYINAKLPSLPNSYVNPVPEIYLNAQAGGIESGSGGSLTSIITGLSSVNLERTLSTGLFTAANQKFIAELANAPAGPSAVTAQLQLLVLQQLVQSGLFSGKDALKILADKFIQLGNNLTVIKAALGLAFSDQILNLIASGNLRQAIAAILKSGGLKTENPEFSQALDLYESLVNLSLLKIGLTQLAQNLDLPELPAQVLGNLESPPQPPSPLPTLSDVISNPVSVAYLKNELSKHLVNRGEFTNAAAQKGINEAVNAALGKDIQTDDQLRSAIAQELTQRGISTDNVVELTNLASDYLKAEISSKYILDTAIKEDSIDRDTLISRIIRDSGLSANIVRQSVNQAVVAKESLSQRELRDSIVNALSKTQSAEDQSVDIVSADNVIVVEDEPVPEVDYAQEDYDRTELNRENIKQSNLDFDQRSPSIVERPTTPEENRVDDITQITSKEASAQNTLDRGKILIAATNAVIEQALAASRVVPEQPLVIPSLSELKDQLQTGLVSKLSPSLGAEQANEFAAQIIHNLVGNEQTHLEMRDPLSFTRQVQDQIDTVKKFHSESLDKALQENFVEFQKTNVDLYSFNLKLMDPANALIFSMWTGIMYQGQGPTNFQHALQFNV